MSPVSVAIKSGLCPLAVLLTEANGKKTEVCPHVYTCACVIKPSSCCPFFSFPNNCQSGKGTCTYIYVSKALPSVYTSCLQPQDLRLAPRTHFSFRHRGTEQSDQQQAFAMRPPDWLLEVLHPPHLLLPTSPLAPDTTAASQLAMSQKLTLRSLTTQKNNRHQYFMMVNVWHQKQKKKGL